MKTNTIEKVDIKIKAPEIYQVTVHNNNETTMEGVIFLLMDVFNLKDTEAIDLMSKIHFSGKGVAFEGPRDLAQPFHVLAQNYCQTQIPVLKLETLVITLDKV